MVSFIYRGKTYQFRNPDFGNRDELGFQRINRRTRSGDLILFRDSDWPKTEVLNLAFVFLSDSDAKQLLWLIKYSMGDTIQYRDHENRLWEGVIQNPNVDVNQSSRNKWVVNVILEGDLV